MIFGFQQPAVWFVNCEFIDEADSRGYRSKDVRLSIVLVRCIDKLEISLHILSASRLLTNWLAYLRLK
jgi:hypothetical protein